MRFHSPTLLMLLSATLTSADDLVTKTRIKVQLFAGPAFVSEVSVDAYHKQCLSLDNNLIDGRVQSFLIGGHDVATVLQRDDYWNCKFFDNYECRENNEVLTVPDGVNNLASIDWGTRIHGLRCDNFQNS
ncbi:hypothetical protein DE146DRAFT_668606 [Phaeosphaeria sp. MPI-PUGE-AT-0046c]|nr:hypothetical protein DE146DRAFT_668606 [Phaeosphaeria sp. MPI-PUGE-AT-0046c]